MWAPQNISAGQYIYIINNVKLNSVQHVSNYLGSSSGSRRYISYSEAEIYVICYCLELYITKLKLRITNTTFLKMTTCGLAVYCKINIIPSS
jgi:hypothetical protein